MHDANQSFERTIDRVLLRKSRRRVSRPADAKLAQLSAYPENKVKVLTIIPVPSENARALDLRVPEEESSDGLKSNRSSARLSISRSSKVKKRSNDDNEFTTRDVKRYQNVDVRREERSRKLAKSPKEERKGTQRIATMDKLSSLQAKLERGLRNISNKTKARAKVRSDAPKDFSGSSNMSPIARGSGRPISTMRKNPSSSREDKRRESSSVSTKQLFSLTESWSSDSVISRSDNCACCHSQEPCPLHGSDIFHEK